MRYRTRFRTLSLSVGWFWDTNNALQRDTAKLIHKIFINSLRTTDGHK